MRFFPHILISFLLIGLIKSWIFATNVAEAIGLSIVGISFMFLSWMQKESACVEKSAEIADLEKEVAKLKLVREKVLMETELGRVLGQQKGQQVEAKKFNF